MPRNTSPVLRMSVNGDYGLPIYRRFRAPDHLKTRRQLRREGLSVAGLPEVGWVDTALHHLAALYDSTKARPVRPITERQAAALAAGREGRWTDCVLCSARTIREPAAEGAYCPGCALF
jgi:hypothetical protein